MGTYALVLSIQAAIFTIGVVVGLLVFRLGWSSSILAVALALPAPLFTATGGTAGFIYLPDIIACLVAPWVVKRWLSAGEDPAYERIPLLWGATAILVLLPLSSTALGWVTDPSGRSVKFVVLELGRGVGYLLIFSMMINRARTEARPDLILALQCIVLTLFFACGLAQFHLHVNLDLWKQVTGAYQIYEDSGYRDVGGGFMGLYRGAVGAWCVGVLAVAPIVLAQRRLGVFWAAVASVACLGATLGAGSRQGVVIGLVILALALIVSTVVAPPRGRFRASMRSIIMVIALVALALIGWSRGANYEFKKYVVKRFESLMDPAQLWSEAAARDPQGMRRAWEVITGDPRVFFVGSGYGIGIYFPRRFTYVDSEFLWVWQIGGVVLLVAYAAFIGATIYRLVRQLRFAGPYEKAVIGSGVLVLVGGVFLTYGHFFLLHTRSPEAPVGYWAWSVLGLAVGVGTRRYWRAPEGIPAEEMLPTVEIVASDHSWED